MINLLQRCLGILAVAATFCGGPDAHAIPAAHQPAQPESPPAAQSADIQLQDALAIEGVVNAKRYPLRIDAIDARIAAGTFKPPQAGEEIELSDGTKKTWQPVTLNKDGAIEASAFRSGYIFWNVTSPSDRIMLLEASGHGMVYINNEPRAGDPYANGIMTLPVLLKKGDNTFLFAFGRGDMRAKLTTPRAELMIDTRDATLPDIVTGEDDPLEGAIVIINAGPRRWAGQQSLDIVTTPTFGGQCTCPLPPVEPMSVRKVAFTAVRLKGMQFRPEGEKINLRLVGRDHYQNKPLDHAEVSLRVRQPKQTIKRTFASTIDDSIQYYAINPASFSESTDPRLAAANAPLPALILSLHGASVEAINQADAYGPKSWATIVCPTNRRPFGFDWEDWGRLDALEVLAHAQQSIAHDPSRTYLTGHSMGGHGTWQLGALFPDKFAAIGPSAGWSSFKSYTGTGAAENPDPVIELLQRAAAASETLDYARNYETQGVYILHGDADDNVPIQQARDMREALAKFHHDLSWHEQPGAGHWWGLGDEPGTACVDWPPMLDLFARRRLAPDAEIRDVRFVTPMPGISASSHWATIEAQIKPMKPSSVDLRFDPAHRRFTGTTENVERLSLSVAHAGPGPITVELDGQKLAEIPRPAGGTPRIWLFRAGGPAPTDPPMWSSGPAPSLALKGPHRAGRFKDAFRNHVLLVYGTQGTAEENAWAFAKARYDSETFYYRGNATLEFIADTSFDPRLQPDRNIILYGNADTNTAWDRLLADSPVQINNGHLTAGNRRLDGNDLACLFIRPRPGSDIASVGVISGTGPAGFRTADRLPIFLSGVGYPDVTVLSTDTLTHGPAGVRATGYFGNDWSIETGEFAWRD